MAASWAGAALLYVSCGAGQRVEMLVIAQAERSFSSLIYLRKGYKSRLFVLGLYNIWLRREPGSRLRCSEPS